LFVLVHPVNGWAQAITTEEAFSPRQGAIELVLKSINNAKSSIHMAAYSFTSKVIASALVAAHDRGVDVQLVLDKGQYNGRVVRYVVEHAIPVRINYKYAIMHNKFMVIDNSVVELGSFNYTEAATMRNAENVLVLHDDEHAVQLYEAQWQKLWCEGENWNADATQSSHKHKKKK
jgi:phosphatidylserine/phosphatidylglycerophosphate/cardiolipin synthase-like enzyme